MTPWCRTKRGRRHGASTQVGPRYAPSSANLARSRGWLRARSRASRRSLAGEEVVNLGRTAALDLEQARKSGGLAPS